MALTSPVRLRVDDPTGVAPARRAGEQMADKLGFDEQRRGEVAIVVTELATNLVRHAGSGEIVLRPTPGVEASIDAIAWDSGPGIPNTVRARGDGFSTAGGAGTGLGAIGRLSSTVDLQAADGQGTVIAARVGDDAPAPGVDGLALAMAGETACGDAWTQVREGDLVTIMLADGLGHGDDAAAAANAAVREVRTGLDAQSMAERLHGALRSTRGAAGAVARLNVRTGALDFAGIGNIAAAIVDGPESKSLASMPGTLGHRVERFRSFNHEVPPGALLVLHSDGCRSGWDLARYAGAQRRDPLVIASLLIRDFERGRDDVSVVVARTAAERL
jgi:anti-sigma regulatory factor (Ser/Thr protein kinase)